MRLMQINMWREL